MLLIRRRVEESVYIGGARVLVMGVDSTGRVLLGIDAPDDVQVLREELLDRVLEEVAPSAIEAEGPRGA